MGMIWCRWRVIMVHKGHQLLLMSSGPIALPTLRLRWPTATITPTISATTGTLRLRKERAILVHLLRSLGALMILSFKGRRGLLAIKCIVLKVKWKGLSGKASGGLKIGAHKWCMDGGDLMMDAGVVDYKDKWCIWLLVKDPHWRIKKNMDWTVDIYSNGLSFMVDNFLKRCSISVCYSGEGCLSHQNDCFFLHFFYIYTHIKTVKKH